MTALGVFPDHFLGDLPPERARRLFKESVTQVEIEAFTFCNRTCWFCPNAHIDRRSTNRLMDGALYRRILDDLAAIEYDQVITFSRYNEPLADRIILERLRQARQHLPLACLSAHSNGDYLDLSYLGELREAGLNRLHVQVYLGNQERFDDGKILGRMTQRLKALARPYVFTLIAPGTRYVAAVAFDGMDVTFDARNFDEIGVDRGQTVTLARPYRRRSPCMVVFQHLYIDADGSVVPCCNIRSDEPRHQSYVVDRLSEDRSLFQAFASAKLVAWRRGLLTFGAKRAPCDTCRYECHPETPEWVEATAALAHALGLD